MTKQKARLSAKRILSLVIAVIMAMTLAIPAFAATTPTSPIKEEAGDHAGGKDAGHFVSFKVDKQSFTFIQTENDQQFQFKFYLGAWKNAGVNYAWVYAQGDKPQTLTEAIGKSFTLTWGKTLGGLPGNLFGGNYEVGTDITVTFTADGGKVYNTALGVIYDAGATADIDRWDEQYNIPLTVTVLDKRALNTAIADANAACEKSDLYTVETMEDVRVALANANSVAGNVIIDQETITRYATALDGAVAALEYKPADYTALDEAVAAARKLLEVDKPEEVYTAGSLEKLNTAFAAATAISPDLDIREQADIDKAAGDLKAAVDGIVKFADYSKMNDAIAAFEKLNANYYDKDVLADIKAKIDDVKNEMKIENRKDESHQADVDKRAEELLNEINSLEKLPADYDVLREALEKAELKLAADNIGNYTPDSVLALQNAYNKARQIPADYDITRQAEIDKAAADLNEATGKLTLKGADYTALDNAITKAKAELARADIADFTEASVSALQNALKAAQSVSRELTIEEQDVIRNAASDLLAATRKLELKPADYTKLDAAIAARRADVEKAKAEGIYTEASITRVEIAIGAAEAVDRTYSVKEQAIVDDATATLNSVKLEIKPADVTALKKAIEDAKAKLNSADDTITDESKEALKQAIKDGEALLASKPDITRQDEVNKAAEALENQNLELKDADYSKLDEAIKDAEDFLNDPANKDLYTPESIQKVQDALDAAKEIDRNLDITHQDEIDNAADNLDKIMNDGGLDFAGADVSALDKAITDATAKLTAEDIGDYTDESVQAMREALEEAQALLDSRPTVKDQAKVNATANALSAMTLTLKGADYTALDEALAGAIAKYEEAKASDKYTDESLGELKAAIDNAQDLSRQLTIREQSQVDEAMAALNVTLVFKSADLSDLNNAIAEAEAKLNAEDIANYTPESVLALRNALDEAKALRDSNPDVNAGEDIAKAIAKLESTELVLKRADYTALDAAIIAADKKLADGKDYTVESVNAVKAAIAEAKGIERDMDITYQSAIDEAVAKLNAAVGALEEYTPLNSFVITNNGVPIDASKTVNVKATWYKAYKKANTVLGVQANGGAQIKNVRYELANWSVDTPEANITENGDGTATITPNGQGIGGRSVWVKVTVEDYNGNTVSQLVKVRFYKWSWQMQ